jgi:hypothetical protein
VLRDGRTVAELPRGEISEPAIMSAMAHGREGRHESRGVVDG